MNACENHEGLARRCATTEAKVEGIEDWVDKLEDKIDEMQKTLNGINNQISRAYGMARLVVWLVGLATGGATVWRIIAG